MSIEEYWLKFKFKNNIDTNKYDSFSFLDDSLLDLILEGKKKATSSLYVLYAYNKESLPKVNEYSIVCDKYNEPKVIIRNINVEVKPFKDVSEEYALKEGEGDLSLEYWRKVHKEFFIEELKDTPFVFSNDILVVLEEFEICSCQNL